MPQNRCALCGFYVVLENRKSGADFLLRHRFILITTLYFFFYFSAPLGRLTPIEALPISCERSRTRNLLRKPSNAGLEPVFKCSLRSVLSFTLQW